ncbi:unnamed protein product [Amoebophrya sp. A120]|nr:unnamed protein product [Amoebophrya sp. A120]|eukprot:GSA120T00001730001.1
MIFRNGRPLAFASILIFWRFSSISFVKFGPSMKMNYSLFAIQAVVNYKSKSVVLCE